MECTKSELDLFALPPMQTSMERSHWQDFYPVASVGTGPIEFLIQGTPEDYVDLSQTELYVQVRVRKQDDSDFEDGEVVAPVNLFLHSLFSQVDVTLNEKVVTPASNTYPYRAMLETLLTYGYDAKRSQLTSGLYYKDTAGKMETIGGENKGSNKRHALLKNNQYMLELSGPIHSDVFQQNRLLLNHVDMRVKLVRSANNFALMSENVADVRIDIQKAVLRVRKVKISPSVIMGQAAALRHGTAKYPINRGEVKVVAVARGSLGETRDNLFNGLIPNKVVMSLIDHEAFNGDLKKNPYNFQHFNISHLEVSVDGESLPQRALKTKFDRPHEYLQAFNTVFSGSGKARQDEGLDFERGEYPNGYTLFAFQLTPEISDESCSFHPTRRGNFRVDFKFSRELENTVYLLVYAEFSSLIEIDQARNVTIDYK